MSFQVDIATHTHFAARCRELHCHWEGPLRDFHGEAEDDAMGHANMHHLWWNRYQAAIEKLDEEGDTNTIVEYYDNLTIPTSPCPSHPYTGNRPRFDYSRFDLAVAETKD